MLGLDLPQFNQTLKLMLKRLFATSALVLGLGVAGFAQKVEKPWALGITVGGAFGLGDFGKTQKSTDAAKENGFASYGYTANVHGAYYFHPNIALAARVGYNTFFTNTSKYQEDAKSNYNRTGYTQANLEATGGIYSGINALIGPRGAIQLGGIELYLQPMAGYSTMLASDLIVNSREVKTGSPEQESETSIKSPTVNSGLAYGASLGLRTSLSASVGFFLDLNYLNLGNRDYNYTTTSSESKVVVRPGGALATENSNVTTSAKSKIDISSASVNLGISIHF